MAVSILTVKDRQDDRKALTFQKLHEGRDSCLNSHESRKASLRIFLNTGEPFAFAGIWEENEDSDGHPTQTFAIITTEANAIVAPIHTRMPVLLQPETEPAWLAGDTPLHDLLSCLRPYPAEFLTAYQVSTLANRTAVDKPALITPER